jgi:hypothetical protein
VPFNSRALIKGVGVLAFAIGVVAGAGCGSDGARSTSSPTLSPGSVYEALQQTEAVQIRTVESGRVRLETVGTSGSPAPILSADWVDAFGLSANGKYLAVAYLDNPNHYLAVFRTDRISTDPVSVQKVSELISGSITPTDDGTAVVATVLADRDRSDVSLLARYEFGTLAPQYISIATAIGFPSYLGRVQVVDGGDAVLVGGSPTSACALIKVGLSKEGSTCLRQSAATFSPGVLLADFLGSCGTTDVFATYTDTVPTKFAVIGVTTTAVRELTRVSGLRPRLSCELGSIVSVAPDLSHVLTTQLDL